MARSGATRGSMRNDPIATRPAPSGAGLMKLKPKAKGRTWKPLDLSDVDSPDSSSSQAHSTHPDLDDNQSDLEPKRSDSRSTSHAPEPTTGYFDPLAEQEMDEIRQTFSERLPDPVFLRSNEGVDDGQIQFIQHPNRDVTAHLWSAKSFEWVDIGRYSCARKVIEGQLISADFLQHIHRPEGRPHTLVHFCTLAKGYPDYLETRPPPQPARPQQPATINHVQQRPPFFKPAIHECGRYDSLSTASGSLNNPDFPTLASLSLKDRGSAPSQVGRRTSGLQGLGTPADDPFAESPMLPRMEKPFVSTPDSFRKQLAQRDPGRMDFGFRFPPNTPGSADRHTQRTESIHAVSDRDDFSTSGDRRAFFAEQERTRADRIRQGLLPSDRAPEHKFNLEHLLAVPKEKVLGSPFKPEPRIPMAPKDSVQQTGPTQVRGPQPTLDEGRERMREYLKRLGDGFTTTPTLTSSQEPSGSAFIRGPEPTRPGLDRAPTESVLSTASNATVRPVTIGTVMSKPLGLPLATLGPNQYNAVEKPTSAGSQASRSILRSSDPEPGYYEDRRAHIYNAFDAVNLAPQKFNGPFFQDNVPTVDNPTAQRSTRKSYAEELDNWWSSGSLTQRHDDFLKSLTAAAPSVSLHEKGENGFVVTDRLLVPLYETLASYVHQPSEAQRTPDPFTRFGPPPDWCIDRGRNANNSFFGEDWGETPRRIGRDPRYKPTFGQPRYTLYEEHSEDRWGSGNGGFNNGLGRGSFGSGGFSNDGRGFGNETRGGYPALRYGDGGFPRNSRHQF